MRSSAVCALLFALTLDLSIRPVPTPQLYAGPLHFHARAAMAYTRALAETYPDRVTGTPPSRRAARFIQRTLTSLGYRVTLQRFAVWMYGKRVVGENIIATRPDEDAAAPYVAVLAHYDSPRTTHQAAEDDGSGVGTVLELARSTRGRIAHPIFVATDAEEIGMIGARNLVPYLKAQGDGAAISIDYVNAGAARTLQLTATGQFGGYTPIALREIAREAALQQSAGASSPYGVQEWIDRAVERSFQDQGPLVEAAIPAVNICSVPADLNAARDRYHTPRDVYANFDPRSFAMVGRTAERTMQTVAARVDVRAADGFMLSPARYIPYDALWLLLFLPLVPFIVTAVCCGINLGDRAWAHGLWLLSLTLPGFAAYIFLRQLAAHNILPRFELYPAPPKDPALYVPNDAAVFGLLAILVLGYAVLSVWRTPLFSKGALLMYVTALALAAFAINPFGLWFYLGIFLCVSLLFVERAGAAALAANLAMLAAALAPFAVVISYFSHEIFLGPYIWWYILLQAAYGTWSAWIAGAVLLAALLWWQYVRLATVPFFSIESRRVIALGTRFFFVAVFVLSCTNVFAPASGAQTTMRVDADVALSSLVSLSDGHLRKLADTLHIVAGGEPARSLQWNRVRPALAELRPMNAASALWFALPDGSYWTLDGGRQHVSLRTRPYFSRLLAGKDVIGDLVVSKSTQRATAIVAVPILEHNAVAGVLGASVYLDRLSATLRREMHLPQDTIFYSFDSRALVALNWDKTLIFLEPRKVSPELDRAFGEMLARDRGRETYVFRGKTRTVLYRKSNVTGWWYALGSASR